MTRKERFIVFLLDAVGDDSELAGCVYDRLDLLPDKVLEKKYMGKRLDYQY